MTVMGGGIEAAPAIPLTDETTSLPVEAAVPQTWEPEQWLFAMAIALDKARRRSDPNLPVITPTTILDILDHRRGW